MVVVQRDRGDCFANHDELRPVIDSRSDMERTPEQVARAGRRSLVGCPSRPAPAWSRTLSMGLLTSVKPAQADGGW